MQERRLRVMGSDAVLGVVGGAPSLADAAVERLVDLERRWSRFLPDSEISRANAAAGSPTVVSPETLGLVERAELARRRTGGRFDPTLLGQVVAAGYDRDLAELAPAPEEVRHRVPAHREPGDHAPMERWPLDTAVRVDHREHSILVPAGVGFDPGGIGKGYAADLVVGELLAEGAAGACVSLGGDVRVAGVGPDAAPWQVQVVDPRVTGGAALVTLSLADGAVATSSRLRRRWTRGDGRTAHHLIDPRTGEPADTAVLTCTVVAAEGWQAEALTKVAFVSPVPELLAVLDGADATGIVVSTDGVVRAPGLGRFVGRAAA